MTMRLLSIALLTGAVGLCQQAPAASTLATEVPKLATLSGRVSALMNNQPLRKANLTLRPIENKPGEPPYAATSDAEGKFTFENIEPGKYQLMAERQGYIRQTYGAKGNSFMGVMLNLTAGGAMKDVNLQLTPQAVISGKVTDADGDPVARVMLRLMQFRYMNGKRTPMPTGGASTDENGDYKLSGVAPGHYYLSAVPPRQMGFFGEAARPAKPDGPEEDYVNTFYPGVTDLSSATAIDVAAGRDVPGVEIRLRKAPVVRVKGKVSGGIPNQSTTRMRIMLMAKDSGMRGMFGNSSSTIGKDGSFELTQVPAGSYTLSVVMAEGMMQIFSRQPLEVGNRSIDNVAVALQVPAELKGTVQIEGQAKTDETQAPATLPNMRVFLNPLDDIGMNSPNSVVGDNRTFTLANVSPGKYRVNAMGRPPNSYLKSIRYGGQEILATGLDLSQGAGAGVLEVVFSLAAGEVSGSISTEKPEPGASTTVILVPDPPQPEMPYLYRTGSTDQNGQFSLKGIAPGRYRLYAFEDLEMGAQLDAELMKPMEGQSVELTVKENSREQVTAKRIPTVMVEETKKKIGR